MSIFVLKISPNDWNNESRDKRELSVYKELGAEVAVLAKGNEKDDGRLDEVSGYRVYRLSTRPLGARFPYALNRFASLFTWASFARRLSPDFISGHDLLPALTIAWMASLFNPKKPRLIYDSHEFELGRNVKRGRLVRRLICLWERFLMKRCVLSIMVNDTIADEVQRIHRLSQRPLSLRSTPDFWAIDEMACAETRQKLIEQLGITDESFLVMYHGKVTTMRGVEALIELTARDPNICAVILGDGDSAYLESLRRRVRDKNLENRVLFHRAVPIEELWKYVGAVDLSLMMIEGKAKSYYYSLPNKFFESIQALTPIVSSDFPEMKRIIDRYQIGLTCNPDDPEAILNCVEKMRTNKAFYVQCKENLIRAKEDLCWENEKEVLISAFKEIE